MATRGAGDTARGPQHRAAVTLVGPDGATTGTATCLFSIWEERDTLHWRGCLVAIGPRSAVTQGGQRLHFPSGETALVEITRLGDEEKIRAIFRGRGRAPRVDPRPATG